MNGYKVELRSAQARPPVFVWRGIAPGEDAAVAAARGALALAWRAMAGAVGTRTKAPARWSSAHALITRKDMTIETWRLGRAMYERCAPATDPAETNVREAAAETSKKRFLDAIGAILAHHMLNGAGKVMKGGAKVNLHSYHTAMHDDVSLRVGISGHDLNDHAPQLDETAHQATLALQAAHCAIVGWDGANDHVICSHHVPQSATLDAARRREALRGAAEILAPAIARLTAIGLSDVAQSLLVGRDEGGRA